jgi:hypothetical protein
MDERGDVAASAAPSLGENLPHRPVPGKGKTTAATLPCSGVIAASSRPIGAAYNEGSRDVSV